MEIQKFIKPVNKNHSIKEVVITVFLSNKIDDPQSFETLLESEFSLIFNDFKVIKQFQISLPSDYENAATKLSKSDNIGFRFLNEQDTSVKQVMQGINESERTFLSFHSLDYTRWAHFFELYMQCIKTIALKHQEFQIEAFSLHYIDEFIWESDELLNLELIFKTPNDYLPVSFFNKSHPQINLKFTNEISNLNDVVYVDMLNISVIPTKRPIIQISHNGIYQLNTPIDINNFLNQKAFNERLVMAHNHNKDVLNELLTIDIKKLIQLT
jgi:uncharacterized protein (TIGR04255 family)